MIAKDLVTGWIGDHFAVFTEKTFADKKGHHFFCDGFCQSGYVGIDHGR